MEIKNKISLIKDELIELISDSTIHALPRIVKSKSSIVKMIMLVCFLASACYCAYLITTTVFNYLNYDVITSIETFPEMPAAFPAITICSLNQFQNNNTFELIKDLSIKFDGLLPSIKSYFILNQLLTFNDTFKQSFSYSLNETLLRCLFSGRLCYSSDFEWMFHPLYGNCFRYNTGGNYKDNTINTVGSTNGLHLELFIGNPDNIFDFISKTGYHVLIDNQTWTLEADKGYDVAAGTETNININRLFTYKLPIPYNNCILDSFDSDLYRIISLSNKTYRQIDCFNLCLQRQAIDSCKCYVNSFNKLDGLVPCLDSNQVYCSYSIYMKHLTKNGTQFCSKFCPLECESMSFQITTSFTNYPTKQYADKYLINNPNIKSKFDNDSLNYDMIKKSTLSLNIYYEQLSYTEISQKAKTEIVDLVSNIGGLMGLFLGISFLSFCEIIEAFVDILFILFDKTLDVDKVKPFK